MNAAKEALFACSKCFTRHPFEELSQGQQLCKKCRGDFPVVKCTYCRSEFQQESKSKTSSICKRCEQNVKQYGKPTSCQFCQLPAAFLGGKCQRCSTYYKRYGSPKTCEQCKQKSAFDKGGEGKLMCWACSCSYKRALAKTKHSDPARHSRVFKKEPKAEEKAKKMQKYMDSKKPVREDVTKIEPALPSPKIVHKVAHKERVDGESDHFGEITQLKEKIASLQNILKNKDKEIMGRDQQITQMKSKLFNEENLIREKMKKSLKNHEEKVSDLQKTIRNQAAEITRLKKEASKPKGGGNKKLDLFGSSKKKPASRTQSPTSRSRSRSPVASSSSRSPSPPPKQQRPGSRAESPAVLNNIDTRTLVPSPPPSPGKNSKEHENGSVPIVPVNGSSDPLGLNRSRSPSPVKRGRSRSPSPPESSKVSRTRSPDKVRRSVSPDAATRSPPDVLNTSGSSIAGLEEKESRSSSRSPSPPTSSPMDM